MANGMIVKKALAASNIDALNRYAKAEFDVENGNVLQLLRKSTVAGEGEVWLATKPAAGAGLQHLWMAAEPEYVGVGSGSKVYLNIDTDASDFVIKAGTVFSAFKPQIGDVIVLSADALSAAIGVNTFAVATATDAFLNPAGAAVSGLSLKLIKASYISLPSGVIGDTQRVTAYEFEVVAIV